MVLVCLLLCCSWHLRALSEPQRRRVYAWVHNRPRALAARRFVGPFSSWTNLKTVYGAAGDGVTDDTAAIQNALKAVGTSGRSPVLYFPAGTYRITVTLNLAHAIDISLIGQDSSLTSIVWDGAASGTMFYVNGVAYSKFSRLTFNGSSTA